MNRQFVLGWLDGAASVRRLNCAGCMMAHACEQQGCLMLRAAAREIERLAEDNAILNKAYTRLDGAMREIKPELEMLRAERSGANEVCG